jgi:ABC-type transporter Mla MlaB component
MTSGEPVHLGDCTIQAIPTLHEELVRRLSGNGPVSVDRTGVQRPNTALLQLLAAFVRDLRTQSRSIQWQGESAAFDRAARVLGLSSSLGLPADG